MNDVYTETRVYGGIKLSLYEKAVLDLLKNGPIQRKETLKQLCPKIMSQKKAQSTLNDLEEDGKIKAISKRMDEPKRNWSTWYVLLGQEYLLDIDAGRVIAVVESLRGILFRPPTVTEIAIDTGITPENAEKLAYKYASQTGWFNPHTQPELIKEATEKLGEVLVCAARIRDGKVKENGDSEDFQYTNELEIIEEAKHFLKKYPRMLPKLTYDSEEHEVFSWPNEAQKYIGNYKHKNRNLGAFKFG